MVQVEAECILVDRVAHQRAYTQLIAQAAHAKHGIFQEAGTDALSGMVPMHSQPPQDSNRKRIGHIATHPSR